MYLSKLERPSRDYGQQRKFGRVHRIGVVLLASITFAFSPASEVAAQTASFRSVDTNRDGVLDLEELEVAFGQAGARRLLSTVDRNNDGRITIPELRATYDDDERSQTGRNDDRDDDDRGDDRNDDDDDDEDDDDD